MTNDTQQTHTTEHKPIPLGTRLKSAREALGLERKDVAAQLRLNEKVIVMMEKDKYPSDLPVIFIRGYLRAYGKLLQVPDYEIKKAIEPIKPKPATHDTALTIKQPEPVTSGNYFMRVFTYLILFTLIGLVGMWWYTHTSSSTEAGVSTGASNVIPVINQTSAANAEPTAPPAPTDTASGVVNNAVENKAPLNKTAENQSPTPPVNASQPPVANTNNTNPSSPATAQHKPPAADEENASSAQADPQDAADGEPDNTETNSDNAD